VNEIQALLVRHGKEQDLKVTASRIGTDIASIHMGKALGTARFIEALDSRGIRPRSFAGFGDSPSDYEMYEELLKRGKQARFIFVGGQQDLAGKSLEGVVFTKEHTDGGTLEFLQNESRQMRTRYFSAFAQRHMNEMRILAAGDVLGKESEGWRNVSEHCLVEAVGADILAERLGADREKVVQAALLHDWYKRHEVEMSRSDGVEGYWRSIEEDKVILREKGIAEDIITISKAIIPESADPEYLSNRSVEEKIMYIMDMMTSGTQWMPPLERQKISAKNPNVQAFSESYRKRFNGKSLLELLIEDQAIVVKEFETKLGLATGELVPYLKEELQRRIETKESSA
jgi:HD superfamily phosphodiesterase